jgi:Domain of unknown function (DUF4111)/Nucleotidyltransferase domain
MRGTKPDPDRGPEAEYLGEVAERLRELLGGGLVGVYAGGSFALGDYRRETSDLDVAAVVEEPPGAQTRKLIVERLRHEALPCPARGLELVVYRQRTARSASAELDFELNLNSGRGMALRVDEIPGSAAGHWFPIDRSILSQAGVAILGPPAGEVFAAVDLNALLPQLLESVRWHRRSGEDAGDAVLNACRALRFAEEGRWSSKTAAGQWAVERGETPSDLVEAAIAARRGEGEVARRGAEKLLAEVEGRLRLRR